MGYSINNATKDCRRFKLNEPFPVIGPYLDDKYQGEAYIGSADQPKDGVRVQMYSGSNERGSYMIVFFIQNYNEDFSYTTCIWRY